MASSRNAPASAPMAFLADIHGNLAALDAVLEDIRRRDVRIVYVAGDLLFGGDDPLAVWKRLVEVKAKCVRGLSDAALATLDPTRMNPTDDAQRERMERFLRTRTAVGELVLKYLERLPDSMRIPLVDGREIVVVHGSPADPTTELSHDMSDEEMMALIADDPADIVACGGSHVPFQRDVDEVRVIGLGSVGQSPEGGIAHYTVVTPRLEGTLVEQTWIRYAA
ncbi:metallophosphoesterase family protein [Sandaracinus amylolyticus]|uniref:metallophosphoesterase family protein n=1 Tax=Sandaracinus amylolyticus TaxID=927083 RepID=UPI001F3D9FA2|nr:metallophosphoesterase family protein [Sandaracinus amylolyticus]